MLDITDEIDKVKGDLPRYQPDKRLSRRRNCLFNVVCMIIFAPQNITQLGSYVGYSMSYNDPNVLLSMSANPSSGCVLCLKDSAKTAKDGVKGASLPCGGTGAKPPKNARKKIMGRADSQNER